ncbi:DNA topoisomerase IB [Aeromicrobium panaciterrae]|uniref:DNA topoisomerase IB n=1 Tax=Aeromicrobium panaciterrae TaxID=363861 RepID=UPI0031D4E032
MVRLRRTSPGSAGWSRIKHGRGFRYLDQDGVPLDEIDVERCKRLGIPPAWTAVWICPVENGHLQAVGTDAAGRRQYLYHPEWRIRRDLEKFEKMEGFAASLLKHRAESRRDLREDDMTRERVVATAFSLLDLGMFRIGSDRYAEENGSYGLTTLEKQHVHLDGSAVSFAYAAKSGQEVEVTVRDEVVCGVLRELRQRRSGGTRLLAYKDGGRWKEIGADDVNSYIKELLGEDYSAKDFRTWRGTAIAALALARAKADTPTARKRAVTRAMETVSQHLGNTAAIARTSYVDPRVVDLFHDGVTVKAGHSRAAPGATISRTLERQVLRMLKRA